MESRGRGTLRVLARLGPLDLAAGSDQERRWLYTLMDFALGLTGALLAVGLVTEEDVLGARLRDLQQRLWASIRGYVTVLEEWVRDAAPALGVDPIDILSPDHFLARGGAVRVVDPVEVLGPEELPPPRRKWRLAEPIDIIGPGGDAPRAGRVIGNVEIEEFTR